MFGSKHLPSTSKSGINFIKNEQDALRLTNGLHLLPVITRRHGGVVEDRFGDQGGNLWVVFNLDVQLPQVLIVNLLLIGPTPGVAVIIG